MFGLVSCGGSWGHSKGVLAWNDDGEGLVIQVTRPSWPGVGSKRFDRKAGNSLGCIKKPNNIQNAQHFFALKLSKEDLPKVLDALANSSVVTDVQKLELVNIGESPCWTGHLFQGRFSSVILDEEDLMLAARYVALNPIRARLVPRPQDWAWSSLGAHLGRRDDGLVTVAPLLERLGDVTALVDTEPEEAALAHLRAAEATGRPLGSDDFVTRLEDLVKRRLRPRKPGRKAKVPESAGDLFAGMADEPMQPGNM
jgi:putative transposase